VNAEQAAVGEAGESEGSTGGIVPYPSLFDGFRIDSSAFEVRDFIVAV
jgi:hypothetical protein